MFDRAFFETVLKNQVIEKSRQSAEGAVSVKLQLSSGDTVTVSTIAWVGDGYAIFDVFPPSGKLKPMEKNERRHGAPPFDLSRLAIRYEAITSVEITGASQRGEHPGFKV